MVWSIVALAAVSFTALLTLAQSGRALTCG